MTARKPWTMMVYLAADNNLSTFGVDSLRQMKVAACDNVNILAEFDTGPTNKAKRYFFDGRKPIGPIQENVVKMFGPTNAADPDNLADFIVWGAENYPADHYCVVIWGHGGGVDDDFPRANDNSFVPRHSLLSLFKGTQNDQPKGTLNDQPKGTQNDQPKGILNGQLKELFVPHLQEIEDVLQIGEDALLQAVIDALKEAVSHALGKDVLDGIAKLHLNGKGSQVFKQAQAKQLAIPQGKILEALVADARTQFGDGALSSMRAAFLTALERGILDGLRTGVLHELQIAVLQTVEKHKDDPQAAVQQIRDVALKALLQFLQNGILEAQQMSVLDAVKNDLGSPTKSLAFVDHPENFLTNLGLKNALQLACGRIGQKIDILGLDSCNMNMIEIGYELRDSVNFMVASQDNVPDASWSYDRTIAGLVNQPYMSPQMFAREMVDTYIDAYSDYVRVPAKDGDPAKQDERVTLSALKLEHSKEIVTLIGKLVARLRGALQNLKAREAIFAARERVRTFGGGEFVDLLHLGRILIGADDDSAGRAFAIDPGITEIVNSLSGFFDSDSFIARNRFSDKEKNCNGTSIYLPSYNPEDPEQEKHESRLAHLYSELDFAKETGWGVFVSDFLKQQKDSRQVDKVLARTRCKKTPTAGVPHKAKKALEVVKQASSGAAEELKKVQESQAAAAFVNGSLSGAERVAQAVARKVKSVAAECTNGHGAAHAKTAQ